MLGKESVVYERTWCSGMFLSDGVLVGKESVVFERTWCAFDVREGEGSV